MENKIYDCCIIGCSVAGMTAAVYLGRAEKKTAIIDSGFGGNIAKSPRVENIPGFKSVSGVDFASTLYEQMTSYETVEHLFNSVISVGYKHGIMLVKLDDGNTIACLSLIIATGTEHKKLNLDTKNIYYCATCDGAFFKNKPVIVVGSGNTGAAYALELAQYCKKVYLCDIVDHMLCETITQNEINSNPKIEWLPNSTIKSVINDEAGNLVSVQMTNDKVIKANAIFAAIGLTPKTEIFKQFVKLDDKGYAIADETCASGIIPGVFVAGDCRAKKVRQVTTAAADGTVSALGVLDYLKTLK